MVMTTQDRIELLKKAREAKAKKKQEADALKPIPVKGRPKKQVESVGKTLDLVDKLDIADEEIDDIIHEPIKVPKRTSKKKEVEPEQELEPEIVEEIQVKRIRKPKKRIVRKIIKEQYDSDSTDVSYEEVVYSAPKHRPKQPRPKNVEISKEEPTPRPPEPEVRKSAFNLFSY